MKLKDIRIRKCLSQQAVADGIGCSANTYSRYEREEREPSIDIIVALADFFEVSIDELFGRIYDPYGKMDEYERDLLFAARKADNRAKSDALELLRSHPK